MPRTRRMLQRSEDRMSRHEKRSQGRAGAARSKSAAPAARRPLAPSGPLPASDVPIALLSLVAAWVALFARPLFRARLFTLGDTSYLRAFAEFSSERWLEFHQ